MFLTTPLIKYDGVLYNNKNDNFYHHPFFKKTEIHVISISARLKTGDDIAYKHIINLIYA
ncbi:hypothetical protein GCM10010912_19760 [Paenibacillus albidus]|uniref:Uncharacterized protein n=1 Tax=Paenibacillus albidus TaxID=2041023 RepID=A0A917C7Q0_9BACL|nr:hypothetical protein GCM10010912_19760 [Paenibacillus albidus]